ncbi:predicted protein, partial [Streptomyces sp. C]
RCPPYGRCSFSRPDAPHGPAELLLAGPQLALGYVDDPERTAERFPAADPARGTGRWYRTGDLVTQAPDGSLVFHGRIDHQVKIRGHRVDLLDVEGALGRLPGVTAVAAAGHRKGDHTALVAFVVLPGPAGSGDGTAELRERLREAVPAPLVPDRIIAVPELVHTRTGKVDRAGTLDRYL